MAIVNNTSSEIGDILRIQTRIPIVGVVSLYSFLDNTEGEYVTPSVNSIPFPRGFVWQQTKNNQTKLFSYDPDNQTVRSFNTSTLSNELFEAYKITPIDATNKAPTVVTDIDATTYAIRESNNVVEVFKFNSTLKTFIGKVSSGLFVSDLRGGKVLNDIIYFVGKNISGKWCIFSYDPTDDSFTLEHESTLPYEPIFTTTDESDSIFLRLSGTIQWQSFNTSTKVLNTLRQSSYQIGNTMYYSSGYVYYVNGTNRVINVYDIQSDTWGAVSFPVGIPSTDEFYQYFSENGKIYLGGVSNDIVLWLFDTADDSFSEVGVVSESRVFSKEFRYSVDAGSHFTPWIPLSAINLQKVDVSRKDLFVIEYKYIRAGDVTSGNLTWNSTTIQGEIDPILTPIYNRSVFKKFFEVNDSNVLGWAVNVLEKLYFRGILPDYINRGDMVENPASDDKDFTTFFLTLTHFFAIIVYYARQYEDVRTNPILSREFVLSRGIIPPQDENESDMSYILNNYVNEYRKRGTYQVTDLKSDGKEIDGELIRLIGLRQFGEFIFGLIEPKKVGWCIGESSPTWSNPKGAINLVKGFEKTKEVTDLTKYPLLNSSFISIVADSGEDIMSLSGFQSSGSATGVGSLDYSTPDQSLLVTVDPLLDYEVGFKVKKLSSDPIELTFKVVAYDIDYNQIDIYNIEDGNIQTDVFDSPLNLSTDGIYYSFRIAIFNQNEPLKPTLIPNFAGHNLKFDSETKFITIEVSVSDLVGGADVNLKDVKIYPLNLSFTQGQLGIKNVMYGSFENKGRLNNSEMTEFIRRYLISYKNNLKIKYTDV